jgi:hypothetical protein
MSIAPSRDWKTLLSFLPPDYERMAIDHKALRPQWLNARVTTAGELLQLIFLHAGADLGLRQTVAVVDAAGGPSISQVCLHKKMKHAAPYLSALVEKMGLHWSAQSTPERWDGYELVAVDASAVCGPGAEGTDARLHTVLRIHDLHPLSVKVTGVEGGETFRRFRWMPGQLVIADRGYSNAPGVDAVVEQGADVLVRVNRGTLQMSDEHGAVDVLVWLRSLDGHAACEKRVSICAGLGRDRHLIKGRLIGFRLPEPAAGQARLRVLREYGTQTTPEMLEAADYVALFTTTPASRLSAARCVEAYRLRWQVELQFKRWKSICHFDKLPNYRDDTIRSWLSAKVLLGMLLDRMDSAVTELFPPECFRGLVPSRHGRRPAPRTATMEGHDAALARRARGHHAARVA